MGLHRVADRHRETMVYNVATKEPSTAAEVEKARERVSAELAFMGYVEGIYLAAKGGVHVRAASTPDHHQGAE